MERLFLSVLIYGLVLEVAISLPVNKTAWTFTKPWMCWCSFLFGNLLKLPNMKILFKYADLETSLWPCVAPSTSWVFSMWVQSCGEKFANQQPTGMNGLIEQNLEKCLWYLEHERNVGDGRKCFTPKTQTAHLIRIKWIENWRLGSRTSWHECHG